MTRPRSTLTLAMLAFVGIALFLSFLALGVWQVQRLCWKRDLMARVESRLSQPPVALPPEAAWSKLDLPLQEYLPVQVRGLWQADRTVLTQAATELGSGYWVVTPLLLADGSCVLVNRGYVPADQREAWLQARGADEPVQLTGLLRLSEPTGGFLRRNDPAAQRWFSRDVPAIAQAQGLSRVAPFFVDAGLPERAPAVAPELATAHTWPLPGLTVVRFHNSHLVYALTWFGLAAMVLLAMGYVARYERRLRQPAVQASQAD